MARSRRVLAAVVGPLALVVAPVRAQSPVVLEGFAARAEPSSAPYFGGLALGGYSGPFGFRVSGALTTARTDGQDYYTYPNEYGCRRRACPDEYGGPSGSSRQVAAWMTDADLLFEPLRAFRVGRALLLGFSPYVFGGIGYYAARPVNAPDTGLTTVNYGVGLRHELLGGLGVSAEARFRRALHGDSTVLSFNRHTAQYRLGLTVSFGGHHTPRRAPPVAVPVYVPAVSAPAASPTVIIPGVSMAVVGAHAIPRVLDLADGSVGAPYLSGGTAPTTGFDAAGFVQYVFGREGIVLPRTVGQLARSGMTVSTRAGNLRPGDLVFFSNDGTTPDHVAIYAGHDRIVHATASGGGVRYDVLGDGARGAWFASHLVAARRVVDGSEAPDRARQNGDAAPAVGNADAPSRPDQAPPPSGAPQ